MKVIVEFEVNNDDFAGNEATKNDAIATVLHRAAIDITHGGGFEQPSQSFTLFDTNGHSIGRAFMTESGQIIKAG